MTPAQRHMQRVRELGCVVCDRQGNPGTPAAAHHIREGAGGGQKSGDYLTIPLCHFHHQGEEGIHTLGTRLWQSRYWGELDLLNETIRRLK